MVSNDEIVGVSGAWIVASTVAYAVIVSASVSAYHDNLLGHVVLVRPCSAAYQ